MKLGVPALVAAAAVLGCIQSLWRESCQDRESYTYWTPPPAVLSTAQASVFAPLTLPTEGATTP